jgi:hypothetical protein
MNFWALLYISILLWEMATWVGRNVQANVGVSDKGAREWWFTPRSRKVLLSTTALALAAAAALICSARRRGWESAAAHARVPKVMDIDLSV